MRVGIAILMAAALAQAAAAAAPSAGRRLATAAAGSYNPSGLLGYRVLANPKTGDDFLMRLGEHQLAQKRSDALFAQVQQLLGGAPSPLDFVRSITPGPGFDQSHAQWDPADQAVQLDPYATWGIVSDTAPIHDGALQLPLGETAHRAQASTDATTREVGSQAFADITAAAAAKRAGIPNSLASEPAGQFDPPALASQIAQLLGSPDGRQWVLAGQFGNTAPITWP